MSRLQAPRPLGAGDGLSGFACGEPSLDQWLRERAQRNEVSGASRTFVSVDVDTGAVVGYYCLSASAIALRDATGALKRNMPDPIPVVLIGRLAVDSRFGGLGLGASLLHDAVLKAIDVSRTIGTRAILVHALSDGARSFYEKFGFVAVPHNQKTMYLLASDAEATLKAAG